MILCQFSALEHMPNRIEELMSPKYNFASQLSKILLNKTELDQIRIHCLCFIGNIISEDNPAYLKLFFEETQDFSQFLNNQFINCDKELSFYVITVARNLVACGDNSFSSNNQVGLNAFELLTRLIAKYFDKFKWKSDEKEFFLVVQMMIRACIKNTGLAMPYFLTFFDLKAIVSPLIENDNTLYEGIELIGAIFCDDSNLQ